MKFSILGSSHTTSFEVRFFNLSAFIASVLGVTSSLINLLNDFPLIFNISVCVTAGSFVIIYYLSRFQNLTEKLKIPFLTVMIVSMTYAWFYSEGILGSTPYLFIFTCLATPFIFKLSKNIVLTIVISIAALLILIQFFYPQAILPYPSYNDRFSDNAVTLVAILVITGITITLFIKNLEREQQTIVDQNYELGRQKEELSAQAEELLAINNQLIELDKFKELMTGMVIHDLKNPLGSIIGLSNQKFSERNLLLIHQSGKQMLNLVMDILDVQKFEHAQIDLNLENIPMQEVISRAITNISGSIEEKNLDIQILGKVGLMIFVDALLIERVFSNVLSNAIKYSDNNAIIEILCEEEKDNQHIKVSITDFGPGIEAEKLSKVFLKFSQISSQKSGRMRSTGLGLAFCKMVIESHHCEIGADSVPDQSTIFWFTLPKPVQPNHIDIAEFNAYSKKNKISFPEQDLVYLQTYLSQIKTLKYYESGKLIPILSTVNEQFSPNIAKWKAEMENAVYANNELVFNELINLQR